jgi:hypothetical protein
MFPMMAAVMLLNSSIKDALMDDPIGLSEAICVEEIIKDNKMRYPIRNCVA